MKENIRLKLTPEKGVFRIIFLYVGQGDSTLLIIPDGDNFKYVLIDINIDKENGGIDIINFIKDLLGEKSLDVFINTHPHEDHLKGLEELSKKVSIREIWHSGHKPGKKHDSFYQEMQSVIKKIGKENEFLLFGTNELNTLRKGINENKKIDKKLGNIDFIILSPAEYLTDDIAQDKSEERYKRIHEQCGVIKFSYGKKQVSLLITGDSDKTAWEEHITDYHKDKLQSEILSASHHGSRTFFKDTEDDKEPYTEHLKFIKPTYVIISAPKQSESKHDHPHDDAINLYKNILKDKKGLIHLGENRENAIIDIDPEGNMKLDIDKASFSEYNFIEKENVNKSFNVTQIDDKPMG